MRHSDPFGTPVPPDKAEPRQIQPPRPLVPRISVPLPLVVIGVFSMGMAFLVVILLAIAALQIYYPPSF